MAADRRSEAGHRRKKRRALKQSASTIHSRLASYGFARNGGACIHSMTLAHRVLSFSLQSGADAEFKKHFFVKTFLVVGAKPETRIELP